MPLCFIHLLQSGGPGSSALRIKNMGDIGGDDKEARGIPRGLPPEGHRKDRVEAAE